MAIAILTLNINLFASDSFIQKCPILNIENKTENDFFQANKLLLELKESYEKTATVYIDILKGYSEIPRPKGRGFLENNSDNSVLF